MGEAPTTTSSPACLNLVPLLACLRCLVLACPAFTIIYIPLFCAKTLTSLTIRRTQFWLGCLNGEKSKPKASSNVRKVSNEGSLAIRTYPIPPPLPATGESQGIVSAIQLPASGGMRQESKSFVHSRNQKREKKQSPGSHHRALSLSSLSYPCMLVRPIALDTVVYYLT